MTTRIKAHTHSICYDSARNSWVYAQLKYAHMVTKRHVFYSVLHSLNSEDLKLKQPPMSLSNKTGKDIVVFGVHMQ